VISLSYAFGNLGSPDFWWFGAISIFVLTFLFYSFYLPVKFWLLSIMLTMFKVMQVVMERTGGPDGNLNVITAMPDIVRFIGLAAETAMFIFAFVCLTKCVLSGQNMLPNSPFGYVFRGVFRWHFTRGIFTPKANDPDRQKDSLR
jgi:hypothetical protein